jgi:putative hydrolase of the HAD superfamily
MQRGKGGAMNVVFDLGGVVLTWDPAAIIASVLDDEHERAAVGAGLFSDADWADLDRGMLSPGDAIGRAAVRTGIPVSRLVELFDAIPAALTPVESVLELVAQVRAGGNRVFVLSNLHRASFEHVHRMLGIFELFDGRVVSCEVGAAKPQPAIYRRLLDDFGLEPADTVFVDDLRVNVEAAAAFGIATVLFTDVAACRDELRALGVHLTSASSKTPESRLT